MAKKQNDLKIIFMGTSSFSQTVLDSLITASYNISAVYTRPDKNAGRDQQPKESIIKKFAKEKNIPVFAPSKLDDQTLEEIRSQSPDLIIVVAYGKILPKNLLDLAPYGALNIHASLLPKYRGPSPIQNTLLSGEKETGITIIKMDEHIDTGEILGQKKISIEPDETLPQLSEKLAKLSAELILEILPLWIDKKITPQKQDDSQATLCQMIERSDGRIIWTDEAESIYNRHRAFYKWPGIFTFWEQDGALRRLKLNKIAFLKNNPEIKHHIGEVFEIGEEIGIQTTSGVVIIKEIQVEGKSSVPVKDFLNGYPGFIGALLK